MRALVIPIFSMRSYEDGKYSLLKDGNFQLTLARIEASDIDWIDLVIPSEDQISDFDEFYESKIKFNEKICFLVNLKYGLNAVETRKNFWEDNGEFLREAIEGYDVIITDITGYPFVDIKPFINNFNITKLPELDRPYIDDFFPSDLNSIAEALFTTVINPRQAEYIAEHSPALKDKVIANTKVASEKNLPMIDWKTKSISELMQAIGAEARAGHEIFWPFRISDKAYRFEEVMDYIVALTPSFLGVKVEITDPNDTFTEELAKKYPFVKKIKLSKEDYYKKLQNRPIIIMLDDPDLVLHPGTIEFFYYGCRIITLKNKILGNGSQIEKIEDLAKYLTWVVKEIPEKYISKFVYLIGELDEYYNKSYIQQKINDQKNKNTNR